MDLEKVLVSSKKLLLSSLKIGGSPLYFLSEQKYKLENFVDKLNEKDKKSYDLIKNEKILKDEEQDALTKTSLRVIKDFAIPLNVKVGDSSTLFWKFFLVNEQEAVNLIKEKLEVREKGPEEVVAKEKSVSLQEKKISKKEFPKEKEQEVLTTIEEIKDEFFKQVKDFFYKNNVNIITQQVLRKNNEIDFEVKLKTPFGKMDYYCVAKNKKRVNEGDLSSAFVRGQTKRLPIIFLTTGGLTKNAKEMLSKDLKGMVVKEFG